MFSFRFLKEAFGTMMVYPGAFPHLFGEFDGFASYIERRAKMDYEGKVQAKQTRGFHIYLSPSDVDSRTSAYISALGYWELAASELFAKVLEKGMTVIDVGANIGWFTLLSAKLVGKRGKVIAFEPVMSSYSLLKRSVERNEFTHVHLENKCVSDVNGDITLFLDSDSLRHSVSRQSENAIQVPSVSLDSVRTRYKIQRVNLLKIDVEGAEARVLAGAETLLSSSAIENIIMEWNPDGWDEHKELLSTLQSSFSTYLIACNSPFLIKSIDRLDSVPPLTNVYLRLDR